MFNSCDLSHLALFPAHLCSGVSAPLGDLPANEGERGTTTPRPCQTTHSLHRHPQNVRSTLDAPSPQERQRLKKWKMIVLECFSVETKQYPKRTRQGSSYYMN